MNKLKIKFRQEPKLKLNLGNVQFVAVADWYDGDYTVTPTTETQVLDTQRKAMTGNIVVAPIPQNYGLITWNGSVLTVS